jgi:hypothetical protein
VTRRCVALAFAVSLAGCGTDSPTTPGPGGPEATPSVVVTSVRWEARQRVGDAGERRFGRCSPYSDAQCRQFNEAIAPTVASNARGDVAALWQRWEGDAYRLASARELPGGGWSASASVAADTGVTNHKLALDAKGEALALWDQQPNGTRSSNGTPAGTWSAPEPVGVPGDPQLAVEPNGTAHLLFTRWQEGLFAMRRAPGGAWSAPVLVRPQGPGSLPYIDDAHLALEPGGGLTAVWLERFQGFGPWNEVWASRAAGGRWTEPAQASRFEGETVPLSLQLAATDESAVAFYRLVERRTDFSDISRVVEQHDAGTAWTAPMPLDTPMAPPSLLWRAEYPVAAADAAGAFTVAWTESFYPSFSEARFRVLARRYAPTSGGWSAPAIVEDTRGYVRDSYQPHVAASAAGDAILLWVEHGVPFTLRASAFVPGRGWTPPETLTRADRLTDISVTMDARGNGVVAWAEPEGDRATVFSVRLAADTVPASR